MLIPNTDINADIIVVSVIVTLTSIDVFSGEGSVSVYYIVCVPSIFTV